MTLRFLLTLLLFSAPLDQASARRALDSAARTYDRAAAEGLVSELEAGATANDDGTAWQLRAEARLLCAELARIEFESLPEQETEARRELGKIIDAHARAGEEAAKRLPDSSETFRIRADLTGTTIRSTYRAGKLRGAMEKNAREALALDPESSRARATLARLTVFRESASVEELEGARRLLEEALTRDGHFEAARLLLAYTLERLGDKEGARDQLETCLRENPDCAPARRALERATMASP